MLKKFFNLQLNIVSSKMLSFWEKDFNSYIEKHLDFLNKNLEDQNNYSLKFSEIFKNMDFLKSNHEETKERRKITKKMSRKINLKIITTINLKARIEQKKDENQSILDAGFDLSDQQLDENLEESESHNENEENILNKENINNVDQEYKVFTTEFDEVAKAETLGGY